MKISLIAFALLIFLLFPALSHTKLIDFEDLTQYDPNGVPTDACGQVAEGYHGFNWSSDRTGNPAAPNPTWASLECFIAMPGTGNTYVHGTEISMESTDNEFNLNSIDVGAYFYDFQDVYAAAWDDNQLKYFSAMTISSAFELNRFTFNFAGIDHFALWAGCGGIPAAPFLADHVLCFDNIYVSDTTPAPVPEPSTLIVLGSGIFGIARLYRIITSQQHA